MVEQYDWDYNDFSSSSLLRRADYLLDVIDNIPDKATSEDIRRLPNGRVLVNYGPASGKSTAIRQYLCDNQMNYIIYAAARKSDVDAMYYDLMAMKEKGIIVRECRIAKFHSNYDPGEDSLRSSNILICTHERLMIEPPSILYRLTGDIPNHLGQVIRSEMIIDELPKFYKSFKVSGTLMMGLGYVNSQLDKFRYDRRQRVAYRYAKFRSLMEAYLDNDESQLSTVEYGAVVSLINAYQQSNIVVKDNDRERAVRKFAYFSDLLAEKLLETTVEDGVISTIDRNLYYTLLDIEVPNIKIFDGTGDLILRGSNSWNIQKDERFSRNLILKQPIQLLEGTSMIRSVTKSEDFEYTKSKIGKLITHIKNLLSQSDSKVLLYTWKSIRLHYSYYEEVTEDDHSKDMKYLPDYIRSLLSPEENSRLEITYYGSGKERVTSEFSDCDSIIIAGKFFIPNSAISNYNEVNSTDITSLDYTKSLIIQAIYRTSARHNQPISIYFSDDYSYDLIGSIMSEFDNIKLDDTDVTGYYKFSQMINHTTRNKKHYEHISKYFNQLYTEGEVTLTVPKGSTGSFTRDYKIAIQNLVKDSPIIYQNIDNSNSFKLIYKG